MAPADASNGARAALVEIFDSIQGEGRHVGQPMAFVRVATCPIRCVYCDTPNSYRAPAEVPIGSGAVESNPVSARTAYDRVRTLRDGRELVVSVTGGEPLVAPAFVLEFGSLVQDAGGRLHLETAALDPVAMQRVAEVCAHVSADYKLPGTLETGDPRAAHRACFEVVANSRASLDVKIVLTPELASDRTRRDETVRELAPWRGRALVVLQPVTPVRDAVTARPAGADVARWAEAFERDGQDVRVIPQTHPVVDVE